MILDREYKAEVYQAQPRRSDLDRVRWQTRGRQAQWQGMLLALLVTAMIAVVNLGVPGGTYAGLADRLAARTMAGVAALSGLPPLIGSAPTDALPGQFVTEQFTDVLGQKMTYYLYLPPGYSRTQHYPLVLVLHGSGEYARPTYSATRNRDLLLGQTYVDDWTAVAIQARWPSIIVVPQVEGASTRWVESRGKQGDYSLHPEPTMALQTAIDIAATIAHDVAGVDTNRLYIAGISMGAFGVWDAIERWPTMFAAAAPISGGGDPAHASQLTSLPVWDFHGDADINVPVSASLNMHTAILAAGGNECLTEPPHLDHGLWVTMRIYASPVFDAWLFAQSRAPAPGSPPPSCKGLVVRGYVAQ